MVRKYPVLITLLLGQMIASRGQEFEWQAGYFGFFDNREYFNSYVIDQTILGARLQAEAGFALNSRSRFSGGLDYLYEMGSKGELTAPDIILYYQGQTNNFDLRLGAFPRHETVDMPRALLNDTLGYYRPAVEGIWLEYHTPAFRHNVWVDWTGRQSENKREAFMMGLSGHYGRGLFLYQHHAVMSHIAHSADPLNEEHIRDNAALAAMAGINLSAYLIFDTLILSSGFLGSCDRVRHISDFAFSAGWLSEAEVKYRGAGLHVSMYKGDSQLIISGDGFYKAPFYTRTDLYYERISRSVSGRAQFSLHFIRELVDLSMSLQVRARLGGRMPLRTRGARH